MTNPINPGIRRTVEWLNKMGWKTCDSGDGKTHDHPCDREYPYVVVVPYSATALAAQADQLCLDLATQGVDFTSDNGPVIQANYSPVDGHAFIDISGVDDEMLFGPQETPSTPDAAELAREVAAKHNWRNLTNEMQDWIEGHGDWEDEDTTDLAATIEGALTQHGKQIAWKGELAMVERDRLASTVQKHKDKLEDLRGLIARAAPLTWVYHKDHRAAQLWEGDAWALLNPEETE